MRPATFNRKSSTGLVPLLGVAVFMLTFSTTVLAATPTTQTFEVNDTLPFFMELGCGFPVNITNLGTIVITSYTDNNGNQVRQLGRTPRLQIILSNPLSGKSISGISPAPVHFDEIAGTLTWTGNLMNISLPHYGQVLSWTGQWRYLLTSSGFAPTDAYEHSGVFRIDSTAICASLV